MRSAQSAPSAHRWARLLLTAVLWWCMLAMVSACPPIEERIEITSERIGILFEACTTGDCGRTLDAGTKPNKSDRARLSAQLMLIRITEGVTELEGAILEARSPCMALNFTCQFNSTKDGTNCLASALNQTLAENIPGGLSFDDLQDLDDVLVILSLHNPQNKVEGCVPENLFACAGLDNVTGTYDIVCASCVNGPATPNSVGPPCVGGCFVRQCHRFLQLHSSSAE